MERFDLSPFCKTKAQAHEFLARLAAISEKIFETDFSLEKEVLTQFGIQKKDIFMKLLRDNNITSQSNNTLKDFLTKLQETTIALPLLSLTIAFEPTEETLKAFSEWFLLNVKKQVLFDIAVDPTLLGGATISYNGKHVNFSIKPTFDKILQEATTIHTPSDTTNHQNIQDIHLGR